MDGTLIGSDAQLFSMEVLKSINTFNTYICLLFTLLFQGRLHLMVWVGSFVTGTANDAFFMALPIVDNFWQVG